MRVLAPRSGHARPSARPPIDMSENLPSHISAESPCNISPQKNLLKNRRTPPVVRIITTAEHWFMFSTYLKNYTFFPPFLMGQKQAVNWTPLLPFVIILPEERRQLWILWGIPASIANKWKTCEQVKETECTAIYPQNSEKKNKQIHQFNKSFLDTFDKHISHFVYWIEA